MLSKDTVVKQLSVALKTVQDHCIGIAVIDGIKGMIIEYDYKDNHMRVITPLPLGGITDEHINAEHAYVNAMGLFPDMTLTQMLDIPVNFAQWCKDYNIK